MNEATPIIVKVTINAPVAKVWEYWTKPEHIMHWNFAADTWECPKAENNLVVGEKFMATMAAKDGSASFDFSGTYTQIVEHQLLKYTIDDDGRKVEVHFAPLENGDTIITETFDPEMLNTTEQQRFGWQSILDNFKEYVENN